MNNEELIEAVRELLDSASPSTAACHSLVPDELLERLAEAAGVNVRA